MTEHRGFDASPGKIRKARAQGSVFRVGSFVQTCGLAAFLGAMAYVHPSTTERLIHLLSTCAYNENLDSLEKLAFLSAQFFHCSLITILSCLIPVCLAGIFAGIWHSGFGFELSLLAPKLSRVSPASGAKRLGAALPRVGSALIKLILLGLCFRGLIRESIPRLTVSMLSPDQLPGVLRAIGLELAGLSVAVLGAFSAVEYLSARHRYRCELSMSCDELRREHREAEGDPHIKGMRKSLHDALRRDDLEKRIRRAKVIIVA